MVNFNLREVVSHPIGITALIPASKMQLSQTHKVVVVSVGAGIALITLLAHYLRRRRRIGRLKSSKFLSAGSKKGHATPCGSKSPCTDGTQAVSPGVRLFRQGSVLSNLGGSDRMSVVSGSSAGGGPDPIGAGTQLTPQQLGVMG
ncbi:UNVERIFIED_CONTAM: hypothetical protein PYX00_006297 [Menopon gallinae]|uniref:Uncharacterized protein n=1 Tax=Menopon gallinae TaxID=328185 RepID=A0AAW2HUU5_9NEOP